MTDVSYDCVICSRGNRHQHTLGEGEISSWEALTTEVNKWCSHYEVAVGDSCIVRRIVPGSAPELWFWEHQTHELVKLNQYLRW